MLQIVSHHDMKTRRSIGAYYTSNAIAEALANWAIRLPEDRVLEPSFGGGALVLAAFNKLEKLRPNFNPHQVTGYDTDRVAESLLQQKLSSRAPKLITADFLSVCPPAPEVGFDCVIANPPFVRHHRNKDRRFKSRCEELGLPKSADLSSLFVLHAIRFLRRGGRIAVMRTTRGYRSFGRRLL